MLTTEMVCYSTLDAGIVLNNMSDSTMSAMDGVQSSGETNDQVSNINTSDAEMFDIRSFRPARRHTTKSEPAAVTHEPGDGAQDSEMTAVSSSDSQLPLVLPAQASSQVIPPRLDIVDDFSNLATFLRLAIRLHFSILEVLGSSALDTGGSETVPCRTLLQRCQTSQVQARRPLMRLGILHQLLLQLKVFNPPISSLLRALKLLRQSYGGWLTVLLFTLFFMILWCQRPPNLQTQLLSRYFSRTSNT